MSKAIVFDLSTEGLESLKDRIVGITTKDELEEKIFTHRDEEKILREFWSYVALGDYDKIIGFNSHQFDVPFLIMRSIKNKVRISKQFRNRSIDLREAVGLQDKKGKLKDFQEMLGIEFPAIGYGKMHMSLLWGASDIKNLREFLLRDVKVTWALYAHMAEAGLV